MDAVRSAISGAEADLRDRILLQTRRLVNRHPIEARDAGRRLDRTISSAIAARHAAKRRSIRNERQILEVARRLAIEFLETEGPPGYLRRVAVPEGTVPSGVREVLLSQEVPEGLLRAAFEVNDWSRQTAEQLWAHVGRFIVGVKGKYARRTSDGKWEFARPLTPLDLHALTGPEAYVQWFIQGKLAFGDTSLDEAEIRQNLRAEDAYATPSMAILALIDDVSREPESRVRSREECWDAAVLLLVVCDPDTNHAALAIKTELPAISTDLVFGLDCARDELESDPLKAAAFWARAAKAVGYLETPMKIPTVVSGTSDLDPANPEDLLDLFLKDCDDFQQRTTATVSNSKLKPPREQEPGCPNSTQDPSEEYRCCDDGLDDRLEVLRTAAAAVSVNAPTQALRKSVDLKLATVIDRAKELRSAFALASDSADSSFARALDSFKDATIGLQPLLQTWRRALIRRRNARESVFLGGLLTPEERSHARPRFTRPVPVCKAAVVLNARGSSVLRKLRSNHRAIDEDADPKTCEFEDLVATFPEKRRRLRAWADTNYPAD